MRHAIVEGWVSLAMPTLFVLYIGVWYGISLEKIYFSWIVRILVLYLYHDINY